jgi:hypothetical protein
MFIKIKNSNARLDDEESFTIIDNVTTVIFFRPTPIRLDSVELLKKYTQDFRVSMVLDYDRVNRIIEHEPDVISKANPYLVNHISFLRGDDEVGEEEDWIFDTVAYIVTDDGKTIEKAPAGGLMTEAVNKLMN